MKTTNLILALIFSFSTASANEGKYLEMMQQNIQLVYTAQTIAELQNIVNTFERIGNAEKTKWEPFYYASFGYIMMANKSIEPTAKDSFLDLADGLLNKAKNIITNESEILALEGFIQMLRISIDPPTRGQKYSSMAMSSFSKAIEMNPENPRALALMAQMQYGTAQFFKSSTDEACATVAKAIEKFSTYTSSNPLAPRWGKSMTVELKNNCK